MSQDIRKYDLIRVDNSRSETPVDDEAGSMSVTATVGPTDGDVSGTRGVQLTFSTGNGYSYARLSEPQVRDLIDVLETRIDPDERFEATGWYADNQLIGPRGEPI